MKFASQTSIKGLIVVAVATTAGAIVAQRNMAAAPPPAKSSEAASRPQVEVVHPRRVTVAQRLQTNATLEAFETADLFAKGTGYLSDVRVDIGDHVKAGQVLAIIDIPELEQQLAENQAQLASKQSALETARRHPDARVMKMLRTMHKAKTGKDIHFQVPRHEGDFGYRRKPQHAEAPRLNGRTVLYARGRPDRTQGSRRRQPASRAGMPCRGRCRPAHRR